MANFKIVVTEPRSGFIPSEVCAARVSPLLIKIFYVDDADSEAVKTLASALDAAVDADLALEAVRARFCALARWALRSAHSVGPRDQITDAAILDAVAHTPLRFDGAGYCFADDEFVAALAQHSEGSRARYAGSVH